MFVFMSCGHVMERERLAAFGLTLSTPVVYVDEGPSSHFRIIQNPMDGCLLAV